MNELYKGIRSIVCAKGPGYNHATTNLAIYSNYDKLTEALNMLFMYIIVIQVYKKLHENLYYSTLVSILARHRLRTRYPFHSFNMSLFVLMLQVQVNNFSVMSERVPVFLG